jgi:hypothetical protein
VTCEIASTVINREAEAIGATLTASAFMLSASPAPSQARIDEPLSRRLFSRRLRFALAALCLRRDN